MVTSWNASLPPFPYTGAFTSDWETQPGQEFVYKLSLSPGSYEISVLPDLIVLTTATGSVTPDDINYFGEEALISSAYIVRTVEWWDTNGHYYTGESWVATLQSKEDTLALQAMQDAGVYPNYGIFDYYTATVSIEAEKTVSYLDGSREVYTDDYYLYLGGWKTSYPHEPDGAQVSLSGRFLITLGNPTGQRTETWGGEWLNIQSFFDYYEPPAPPPSTDLDPTNLPASIEFLPTSDGHAVESPPIQTNVDPAWWLDTGKSVFLGYVPTALDALKGVADASGNFKVGAALDVVNSATNAASAYDLLHNFFNKLWTHGAEGMTRTAQALGSSSPNAYDWVPGWFTEGEKIVTDFKQDVKDFTVSNIFDALLPGTLSGTVYGVFRSILSGASEKNSFSLALHVPELPVQGGDKTDVLFGGNGDDELQLGAGTDFALGLEGNDIISAGDGNDWLRGGEGNDILDGGTGSDTASYSGNLSSYTLTKTAGSYTVSDHTGTDGTDTLTNVERLQFTDMTVNLTVQANATTLASAQLQRLEELYVGFFNRVPDADGLSYWIDQFKGGLSVNQIAESFYSAGVQYASLTGFSATMSNEDFVNVVYRNVLGRTSGADAEGLAYWSAALANGSESHGSLVSTILDSAHSFKGDGTWGWVADLLDNKILVADKFAVDWGLNYNTPDASISNGMAIAAAVTPTDTTAAIALIGIPEGQISLG